MRFNLIYEWPFNNSGKNRNFYLQDDFDCSWALIWTPPWNNVLNTATPPFCSSSEKIIFEFELDINICILFKKYMCSTVSVIFSTFSIRWRSLISPPLLCQQYWRSGGKIARPQLTSPTENHAIKFPSMHLIKIPKNIEPQISSFCPVFDFFKLSNLEATLFFQKRI